MFQHDTTEALWRWSAAEIAEAIRRRQVTSVAVTEAFLERIEETNGVLGAIFELRPDEAIAQARTADRAVASGAPLGPLHGVPTSIKLNTDQEGRPTSHGVVSLADDVATHDAPVVANVRAAGAVLLGGTNLPAFSLRWFTGNDHYGTTLNPWDHRRTPGGSGGGGAAAVAAGMLPIAHGNDIGGSVRYPAYACGVAGLRPSLSPDLNWLSHPGRPYRPTQDDTLSGQLLSVEGWIARSTRDLRLGWQAMTPPEFLPTFSLTGQATGRRGLPKVGVVRDIGVAAPHPTVSATLDDAAAWLSDAGYEVEDIKLPLLEEAYRLWNFFMFEDLRPSMPDVRRLVDRTVRENMAASYEVTARMWGQGATLADYIHQWSRRATLVTLVEAVLRDYPIVLTPSSAEPPFLQDRDTHGADEVQALTAAQWPMIAIPVLGLPGVAVPTGVVDGLPTGVHLFGGRYSDLVLLDAADALENRAGRFWPDRHTGSRPEPA